MKTFKQFQEEKKFGPDGKPISKKDDLLKRMSKGYDKNVKGKLKDLESKARKPTQSPDGSYEVKFNKEDLTLIDDKAKKIISEFYIKFKEINELNRDNLEPIVQELIKTNETNFKGVGQPLRIALTGSKFGPGIYDIIISLGKDVVEKRLTNKTIS